MGQRIVISKKSLLAIAVFGLFCILSVSGLKLFDPWPQITYLWDSGLSLLELIDHFHFERYLVSYPGLLLEQMWPGLGFSLYISLFATLNTLLFRQVHKTFTGYPPNVLAYAVFLLIHLAMNGRGAIGWCGWLLCLGLHGRFEEADRSKPFLSVTNSCLLFLSILFSSVSSGVFMVVFAANILLIVRAFRASLRRRALSLPRILSALFAAAIIGYGIYRAVLYMLDALLKIQLFFGSYAEVFSHGLGLLVEHYDISLVLLALAVAAISFGLFWTILKRRVSPVLWPLLTISLLGGAFGFTTLTLNIPLFLILFSLLYRLLLSRVSARKPHGRLAP